MQLGTTADHRLGVHAVEGLGGRVGQAGRDAAAQKMTRASTKWVTEPAAITIVRFQTGKRHIARGSSSADVVVLRRHPDDLDEAAERDAP